MLLDFETSGDTARLSVAEFRSAIRVVVVGGGEVKRELRPLKGCFARVTRRLY